MTDLIDLDRLHEQWMADPEYAAAYEHAHAVQDRSIAVPCHWGYCQHDVDPATNQTVSGMGPMACPCDHSKGWRSPYVEGQARPHVPTKARGRHGSRRQRAIHRQRTMPDYGSMLTYLPGQPRFPRSTHA